MDNVIRRMRRGHAAASARARLLVQEEGPNPERAVAEALAALEALASMGQWPGPRDRVSERGVEEVRHRWVRIARRAREKAQSER